MADDITERVLSEILAKAAEIYASRRSVIKALPEFDDATKALRIELAKVWFMNKGEQEKSPSGAFYLIMNEAAKYAKDFYDCTLDIGSIIEASSLVREKQLHTSNRRY